MPRANNENPVSLTIQSGPRQEVGRRLETWTEYEVVEDLFTPANHFTLTLSLAGAGMDVPQEEYVARVCDLTRPDAVVTLELDGVRLGTAIILEQNVTEGANGEGVIEVSGADPAILLTSNEVDPKLKIKSDTTLPDLADTILAQYRGKGLKLEVVADDVANRTLLTGKLIGSGKTVQTSRGPAAIKRGGAPLSFIKNSLADTQPHPGETEWAFLQRHAENLGVLMYFTADAELVFITPDYDQEELYLFQRLRSNQDITNILSGGRRLSLSEAATSVHVLSRGSLYRSADPRVTTKHKRKSKKKPPIAGEAVTDLPFTWQRRRFLRDTNPSNNDEAKRVAQRALAMRNANAVVYEYMVDGHTSRAGYRYAVNTMARLQDEILRPNVDAAVYLTKRVLRKRRGEENAMTTMLTMVPKGAIVL